ncbi:hypothetical protein Bca4012_011212 [Brassica carinata]
MMTSMEGMVEKGVLDDIIRRLLEGKGGKQVQLSESEIRQLCFNARQIFLSQPNLLELHVPIRICGSYVVFYILKVRMLCSTWEIVPIHVDRLHRILADQKKRVPYLELGI